MKAIVGILVVLGGMMFAPSAQALQTGPQYVRSMTAQCLRDYSERDVEKIFEDANLKRDQRTAVRQDFCQCMGKTKNEILVRRMAEKPGFERDVKTALRAATGKDPLQSAIDSYLASVPQEEAYQICANPALVSGSAPYVGTGMGTGARRTDRIYDACWQKNAASVNRIFAHLPTSQRQAALQQQCACLSTSANMLLKIADEQAQAMPAADRERWYKSDGYKRLNRDIMVRANNECSSGR